MLKTFKNLLGNLFLASKWPISFHSLVNFSPNRTHLAAKFALSEKKIAPIYSIINPQISSKFDLNWYKAATFRLPPGDLLRLCLFLLLTIPTWAWAQDEQLRYENKVYDPQIASVQMQVGNAQLTHPIVELGANMGSLLIEFDQFGEDPLNYTYTLVHCDHNWKPSELTDFEYIDGFVENRLLDYKTSTNTISSYYHYSLSLPNREIRWTKSGNYLLKIYADEDEKRLVITRRFMVVEPKWRLQIANVPVAMVDKRDTYQELDFSVDHTGMRVPNPQQDVHAYILQNGRWDNALGPFPPHVTRENKLIYDYQDKIVFPGGKEWRYFDMRSFDFRRENVAEITRKPDFYEVTLRRDKDRSRLPYNLVHDIDGRYAIATLNSSQNTNLECDYANVLFSLERKAEEQENDIYVFGELTNWELNPEYKMQYSPEAKAYYTEIKQLKQGLYNYDYVMVDKETGKVDIDGLEGNSYETNNQYTVLVYFRPIGERYDRLMAAATVTSHQSK